MGVILIDKLWEGTTFSTSSNGNADEALYGVWFDRPAEDVRRQACFARGIPRQGDPHPGENDIFVVGVTAKHTKPLYCEVSVQYGKINPTAIDTGSQEKAPWSLPDQRTWSFDTSQEEISTDKDGKPIINSAEQRFAQPLMEEMDDPVLVVVRNQPNFDYAEAYRYSRATNSDQFYGADPGHVRMMITGDEQHAGSWDFWRVTYRCRFRKDGWKHRVEDRGMFVFRRDKNKKIITNADGSSCYDPCQAGSGETMEFSLNGKGGRLRQGAAKVWLNFETRPQLPFGKFRLEEAGKAAGGMPAGRFIANKWSAGG